MKKLIYLFVGIAVVATSCVSSKKYKECSDARISCEYELKEFKAKNLTMSEKIVDLEAQNDRLKTQLESLSSNSEKRAAELKNLKQLYTTLQKNYDELLASNEKLSTANRAEVDKLLKQTQALKADLDKREVELKQAEEAALQKQALADDAMKQLAEKEQKLAELQAILDQKDAAVRELRQKVKNALNVYEGKGLTVEQRNGKVYVSMDEKLLFASGSFTVGAEGQKALGELADVLATDSDINVMIEGHTDNVPYNAATTAQIRDNWDLSVMRATAIVKILTKNSGIDPKRITAAGRAEYVPVAMGDTKEARAKNRRTEIILTPKLDELFKILE